MLRFTSAALQDNNFAFLGLSLTALLPAAAWYFVFIVGHFLPPQGQKMTHKGLNPTDKRKSYFCS